jgi:hypothetical protein
MVKTAREGSNVFKKIMTLKQKVKKLFVLGCLYIEVEIWSEMAGQRWQSGEKTHDVQRHIDAMLIEKESKP